VPSDPTAGALATIPTGYDQSSGGVAAATAAKADSVLAQRATRTIDPQPPTSSTQLMA
jgi:hypothetical protein